MITRNALTSLGRLSLGSLVVVSLVAGCSSTRRDRDSADEPEQELVEAPPLSADEKRLAQLEDELAAATAALEVRPKGEMEHIWLGRRLAYLGRYREAIEAFDRGLRFHPKSYRLLRHRGHRFITLREFDRAVADLGRAAEFAHGHADAIEPDGQPNERNVPTSTTKSNIYYHLGLAHYLAGNQERAVSAWRECMKYSHATDDMLVANVYWLTLALHRLQRRDEMRTLLRNTIRADMDIIENHAYYRLVRLFSGELFGDDPLAGVGPDEIAYPTLAYGLGAWAMNNGRPEEARGRFEDIVSHTNRAAFGHIAAEVELTRGL